MPLIDCPSRLELDSFQAGNLGDAELASLESHIEGCSTCQKSLETVIGESADRVLAALLDSAEPDTFASEASCRTAVERVTALARELSAGGGADATVAVVRGNGAASESLPVESIREYKLLAKLGEGGMGAVYKALHTRLDKVVALKVLPAERMRDTGAVARFQREMKAVGKLDHPNIVRAMDAGEEAGMHFLVMEYVEGLDLSQLAKNTGPLPIADACELVRQAALGLAEAHEHGMVHRDIKPSNLILAKPKKKKGEPTVKILDLGLALLSEALAPDAGGLTTSGQMMGTIDYMAPEQGGDSHQVDIRADIYSLGATLYRLLTGSAPFAGDKFDTPVKKLMALATQSPTSARSLRPDVPAPLAAVIDKMLAKSPAARYATPEELAEALAPFCQYANLAALLARGSTSVQSPVAPAAEIGTQNQLSSPSGDTAPTIDRGASPLPLPLGEGRGESATGAKQEPRPLVAALGGRKIPRTLAIAAACGGLALAVLLGITFYIQTQQGTIQVEINDPAIKVVLDNDGNTVFQGVDKKHEIKLKPGPHGMTITRGDFSFDTTQFELKRKEVVVLRIKYLPGKIQITDATGKVRDERPLPAHALQFDGVDDYVELPTLKFDPAEAFTMELWAEVGNPTESPQLLHYSGVPGRRAKMQVGVPLGPDKPNLMSSVTAGPPQQPAENPEYATLRFDENFTGGVQHIALCWSPDGATSLYWNGRRCPNPIVPDRTKSWPTGTSSMIGANPRVDGSRHQFLKGAIRHVRFSRGLRYADEFSPHADWKPDSNTLALYRFDEGAGDTLYDTSGNGHHGKIEGAKWVIATAPAELLGDHLLSPDYEWTEPVSLGAPVNTGGVEAGPCISADGLTLWFHRNFGPEGDYDLWTCSRTALDQPFSEPVSMGPAVNSSSFDASITVTPDGCCLAFNSNRPGGVGKDDLWCARRTARNKPWEPAVPLQGNVNSADSDSNPSLSADGLTLVFSSDRSGGQGGEDLWMSQRDSRESPFGRPVNLGKDINTSGLERWSELTPDALTLLFTRWSGHWEIWMSRRPSIGDPFEPAVRVDTLRELRKGRNAFSLSPDGRTLYFESNFESGNDNIDIYYSRRIPKYLAGQSNSSPPPASPKEVTVRGLPGGGYEASGSNYRVHLVATGLIEKVEAGSTVLIESTAFGRLGASMPSKVQAQHEGTTLTFTEGDDYRLIYEFGPQGFVVKCRVSTAAAGRDGLDGKSNYLFHQTRFPKSAQRVRPLDGVAPFALPATKEEESYTNNFVVDFADGSQIEVRCDQPSEHSGFLWTEGPYTWGRTNLKSDADNEIRYEIRPPGRVPQQSATENPVDHLLSPDYEWTPPVSLGAPVNTKGAEGGPCISADGLTLWFHRNFGSEGHYDLWTCSRASLDEPFSEPVSMGPAVNSSSGDFTPTVTADGCCVVFVSAGPGGSGKEDLWTSRRAARDQPWEAATLLLGDVNSSESEGSPHLSADGLTLVFTSYRGGGQGQEDVWMSQRSSRDAAFGKAVNLGKEVNSSGLEACPELTPDGLTLFFSRWGQRWDQWVSRRRSITEPFGPAVKADFPRECAVMFSLSPDGQTLYFESNFESGNDNIDIYYSRRVPKRPAGQTNASPPPAVAPFDAAQAKEHQTAWAEHLGVPVEWENSLGMKFRLIPPGEFQMGTTPEEVEAILQLEEYVRLAEASKKTPIWKHSLNCVTSESPPHRVILTQPIYLAAHEVTQAQYERIMGKNPSYMAQTGADPEIAKRVAGQDTGGHPVEGMTWGDAAEFCAKLSEQEQLKPWYSRTRDAVAILDGNGYRLPTEAQWEFACRAGTTTRYWIGDTEADLGLGAWTLLNSGGQTHPVGELRPNPFGLYDMLGNVQECTQDWWEPGYYGQFQDEPALDPGGATSPAELAGTRGVRGRVLRGGDWLGHASNNRASSRKTISAHQESFTFGFRVALPVETVKLAIASGQSAQALKPEAARE